jgi:TolB protein
MRLLLLLIALCTAAALPAAAHAVVPGKNGRIAFDSDHDGLADIYTAKPGGRGLKRLTHNKAIEFNPAWSPNGHKIAYERGEQIWVMGAGGKHQHQVTHFKGGVGGPAWSPDGRRLIFATDGDDADIWTIGADGSNIRRITDSPRFQEFEPSYAPNGKRIVYDRDRNDFSHIVTADPDGGRVRVLKRAHGGEPNWSPNGRQITFDDVDDNIYIMKYDGTQVRRVGFGALPAFSPDGKFLAISDQDEEGERGTIFARRIRGLKDFQVSPFPERDLCDNPDWQPLH